MSVTRIPSVGDIVTIFVSSHISYQGTIVSFEGNRMSVDVSGRIVTTERKKPYTAGL